MTDVLLRVRRKRTREDQLQRHGSDGEAGGDAELDALEAPAYVNVEVAAPSSGPGADDEDGGGGDSSSGSGGGATRSKRFRVGLAARAFAFLSLREEAEAEAERRNGSGGGGGGGRDGEGEADGDHAPRTPQLPQKRKRFRRLTDSEGERVLAASRFVDVDLLDTGVCRARTGVSFDDECYVYYAVDEAARAAPSEGDRGCDAASADASAWPRARGPAPAEQVADADADADVDAGVTMRLDPRREHRHVAMLFPEDADASPVSPSSSSSRRSWWWWRSPPPSGTSGRDRRRCRHGGEPRADNDPSRDSFDSNADSIDYPDHDDGDEDEGEDGARHDSAADMDSGNDDDFDDSLGGFDSDDLGDGHPYIFDPCTLDGDDHEDDDDDDDADANDATDSDRARARHRGVSSRARYLSGAATGAIEAWASYGSDKQASDECGSPHSSLGESTPPPPPPPS